MAVLPYTDSITTSENKSLPKKNIVQITLEVAVEDLQCPVNLEIMLSPVVLNCSHIVEEDTSSKITECPICRNPITARCKDNATKKIILAFLKDNPQEWDKVYRSVIGRKNIADMIGDQSYKLLTELQSENIDPRIFHEHLLPLNDCFTPGQEGSTLLELLCNNPTPNPELFTFVLQKLGDKIKQHPAIIKNNNTGMFTLADTLVNNKHMEFAIMLLKAAVIAAGVDLSDFFLEIVNTRDIVKATVFLELLTPEQKESSSLKALSISVENNDLEMLKLLARNGMNLIQFIRTADPNVIKKTLGMLAEESEILNNLFTDPVPQNNRKLLCGVLQYLSLHSAKKIMDQMLRSFVDVIEFLQETEDPEVIKKTIEIQNENISTLRMLFISLALDPNTKLFSLFLNYVRPDDAKSMINASYTVSSKLSQLPLHQAIISHRPDLAIILLQHGADCAPSDLVTGANALQLSILYRQFAILKDHIKLTPELILQKDKAENNALHIAAFINDAETLKILLDIAPKGRKQENVEKRTPRKVAKQISAAECLDVFAEKEQQIAEKKAQVCKKRKNETPDLPPTTFSSPEEAVLKGSVLQVNTLFSKSKLSKDEQEKALLAALETNDLIKISNALMYCREVDFGILLTAIFEHKPCPSADALICVYERLCLCKQPLPDIKILFDYLIHKTIDTKLNPFEKRKDLHDHSILECLGSIDYRKFSSFLDSYSTRYPIKLLIMPLQKPLAADLLNFLAANGYKDAFKSLLDFRKSLVEDNKDGFFTLINVCVAVQAAGENGQAEFLRSPIFGDQVFSTEDRLSLAGMWSDTKETLPMHFAELGKLEVIKVYAEKCPQYIHRIDLSHHSLLHYAIGKDHAEVVRYLVKELNPPFEITDADRELAKQKDNPEIKEILGIESVVAANH